MRALRHLLLAGLGVSATLALSTSTAAPALAAIPSSSVQYRALIPTADGGGYSLVGADGSIAGFGDATDVGHLTSPLNQPVVGAARVPGGAGYWFVAGDGGVFPFGGAAGYGSTGAIRLNQPIVGMASTASGYGYWLVASDGGIFPFGDAGGYGSTGAVRLNKPVTGMAVTPSGHGYWLVASDGGIFPFGDAGGYGSTGAVRLNMPMVGMASTPSGHGYWLVASDGGIFPFGDAGGLGSTGNLRLSAPVAGMASTSSGQGYWLITGDGIVHPFGDAAMYGSVTPPPTTWAANSLHSADGAVNVGVGVYSDCSGITPLTSSGAALDTCVTSVRWYFVGHNPGPFSPLLQEGVGSVITYVDGGRAAHALRIVASRDRAWDSNVSAPTPVSADVVAEFQTCVNPQGTIDRILDAVPG